jgi:hypothetical protein
MSQNEQDHLSKNEVEPDGMAVVEEILRPAKEEKYGLLLNGEFSQIA